MHLIAPRYHLLATGLRPDGGGFVAAKASKFVADCDGIKSPAIGDIDLIGFGFPADAGADRGGRKVNQVGGFAPFGLFRPFHVLRNKVRLCVMLDGVREFVRQIAQAFKVWLPVGAEDDCVGFGVVQGAPFAGAFEGR